MQNPMASGDMTVGSYLTTAALRFGDREAFYCAPTGRRFTFRETNARCNRLVHGLQGLGLKQGDCVAFLTTNRAEIVEIYFALAKTGLVGMPLNYRLAPAEVVALMREVDAAALLFEDKFAEVAALVRKDMPGVRVQVAFGEAGGSAGAGVIAYEQLLAGASDAEPQVRVREADPYYFNLTSGTTGMPKCYVINHYNNATIFNMFHVFEMTRNDVVLTVFPMYGRVGFAWAAASVLYGCRNVIANFKPPEVLELIAREHVTITNLVATMAGMLLAQPELSATDLKPLRAVVFAGSLLPAPIREGTMARICPNLYEYYGMQETAALVASTPEDRARQPGSVGRPILFAEVRVVDGDWRDLPAGQSGAILGRSPGGVTAYYRNPEKSAETFRDGWIQTGDVGYLNEEGYLFISGRLKDVIVTGGQNVHAGEIEATILQLPGVAGCAVIGLPDPLWGECVAAVVVPHEGTQVEPEAVIAWCHQHLAGFKAPKRVFLRGEPLPITATGKIRKFLLVEQYGNVPGGNVVDTEK